MLPTSLLQRPFHCCGLQRQALSSGAGSRLAALTSATHGRLQEPLKVLAMHKRSKALLLDVCIP